MIPYFLRLKENTLKYCWLCKQLCNKRQIVLVYGNITTPLTTARYLHFWCVLNYSFKKRMEMRKWK